MVPRNFLRVFPKLRKGLIVLICNCQGCFLYARTAVKNWKIVWAECSLNYSCVIHSFIQQIFFQHYAAQALSKAPVDPSFNLHSNTARRVFPSFWVWGNSLNESCAPSGRVRTSTRVSQTLLGIRIPGRIWTTQSAFDKHSEWFCSGVVLPSTICLPRLLSEENYMGRAEVPWAMLA